MASYIIDLSNSFDVARYQAEMETVQYIYPHATILLVGLQTDNNPMNITELQSLAGARPYFIIPNVGSRDQQYKVIAIQTIAILYEQLRTAIQPYGNTPLGLALQDLVKLAQQEGPETALVLACETFNLINGLQQSDDSKKLQAVADFYETMKDKLISRQSILSTCLTVLCRILLCVLTVAVCSGVSGGLGFLIAGPVGATVGTLIGVALSIWLSDLAAQKFNSTPHFAGSFCLFKTSIGKSLDKVVSTARRNSLNTEASATDFPADNSTLSAQQSWSKVGHP
ncbi:hypothetical protein [Legionella fairfieldensis]|uniref:hypothetical protein n=1 Tax=Legionella fairfieldensis TaxID=45064 RepID=UPI0010410C19|nr:hypothetical protein [Legionella fairfieldensis]